VLRPGSRNAPVGMRKTSSPGASGEEFIEGYYHRARPHQGLNGDTPVPSAKPEPAADGSRLVSIPVLGGLHHRCIRVAV